MRESYFFMFRRLQNNATSFFLFYKQHFCIPHQAEIWLEIITVSCIKRIQKEKKTLWMKDLLGKEHDRYKIHTLLTKSISAYLPSTSIENLPIWILLPPSFLQKYLDPLFHDFSKISTPLWIRGFTLMGKIFVTMTWP